MHSDGVVVCHLVTCVLYLGIIWEIWSLIDAFANEMMHQNVMLRVCTFLSSWLYTFLLSWWRVWSAFFRLTIARFEALPINLIFYNEIQYLSDHHSLDISMICSLIFWCEECIDAFSAGKLLAYLRANLCRVDVFGKILTQRWGWTVGWSRVLALAFCLNEIVIFSNFANMWLQVLASTSEASFVKNLQVFLWLTCCLMPTWWGI